MLSMLWAGVLLAFASSGGATEESQLKPASSAATIEPIITKEETIEAKAGEKRVIRLGARIVDVTVMRPEVADVFLSEAQAILVVANAPGMGRATVQLDDGETIRYTVRVHVADAEEFAARLRDKIGHIPGINIEVIKGRILVDGRVLYLKDLDAVEKAIADNPSIINLTSLSSRNARILAREIQKEYRESGIYGARVEVRNNRVTLVGTLGSELLRKKAERIAASYTSAFDNLILVVPEIGSGHTP